MILEITQYGNPVLRKKCRKVTKVTDELKQFGEELNRDDGPRSGGRARCASSQS
jgi:hypothetical protein